MHIRSIDISFRANPQTATPPTLSFPIETILPTLGKEIIPSTLYEKRRRNNLHLQYFEVSFICIYVI
jgi:hypothetical protein